MEGRRLRVLVVDDDAMNVDTFRRVFRRDLDVVGATAAAPALAALEAGGFDAILVDFIMPAMNGLDLLASARAIAPSVRRVLVTAVTDDARIVDAERDGRIAGVIVKPWRRDEVLAVLERLVVPPAGGA